MKHDTFAVVPDTMRETCERPTAPDAAGEARSVTPADGRAANLIGKKHCADDADEQPPTVRDFEPALHHKSTIFGCNPYSAFHGGERSDDLREVMPSGLARRTGHEHSAISAAVNDNRHGGVSDSAPCPALADTAETASHTQNRRPPKSHATFHSAGQSRHGVPKEQLEEE